MLTARHTMTLGEGVPEWVHLLPAGTFATVDGRGPWKAPDLAAIIAASGTARLALDENHSTDLAAKRGESAPARGWITEMQARPDGIWGRVEWTPAGRAMMEAKEYRAISPVFTYRPDGTVTQILRASLTNDPALTQLTALNSQETDMDLLARIRAATGLPDTADEAAALAAVAELRQAATAHAAAMERIATGAGLAADASADQVLTALAAARAGSTEVARMAATITALETEVAGMRVNTARAAATAFVDGAIRAGVPINALRDHFIARHMADAATVEKEIAALPRLNVGATPGTFVTLAAAGGDADGLTDMDRAVASKMGVDPKKLAAFKKTKAPETADGRAA